MRNRMNLIRLSLCVSPGKLMTPNELNNAKDSMNVKHAKNVGFKG